MGLRPRLIRMSPPRAVYGIPIISELLLIPFYILFCILCLYSATAAAIPPGKMSWREGRRGRRVE